MSEFCEGCGSQLIQHGPGLFSETEWDECPFCDYYQDRQEAANVKATDRLFVYGTLLSGEVGESGAPSSIRQPAKVRGYLNYAFGTGPGGYPVLRHAEDSAQSWVYGELCHVNLSVEQIMDTIRMELDAGYNVQWRDAYDDDGDLITQAMVFVWPWNDYGATIPGGDWRKRHRPGPLRVPKDEQGLVEANLTYADCDGCLDELPMSQLKQWGNYTLCGVCYPDVD